MGNGRLAMFGCKATTRFLIGELSGSEPLAGLFTIDKRLADANQVADYDDLRDLAGGPVGTVMQVSTYALSADEDVSLVGALGAEAALVMGWQRLIPPRVLALFPKGVYGMHGSARGLPYGRGRSPLNWSILEGQHRFETSLFRYDEGVDSGAVVASRVFSVGSADTAETLHFKNTMAMADLVNVALPDILDGSVTTVTQLPMEPTFYPKRTPADGLIDWAAPVEQVEALIRAVAPPFAGAFTFDAGGEIRITRAAVFETDLARHPLQSAAPGTVGPVFPNGKFLVRCGGGVLIVHEYSGDAPQRGAALGDGDQQRRSFPRNAYGFHDV